jgi:NAD(P)-dependent dehydrogenase (short-subunit alcohol dehydrogenase family)
MTVERSGAGGLRDWRLSHPAVLVIETAGSMAPHIAREAGERGARVTLVTRTTAGNPGHGALVCTSNYESEAEIDRLFDEVLERLSALDVVIVVLDAGSLPALHNVSLERWQSCIAAPLRLSFWLAQRAIDEFVGAGAGGRLIFVIDQPGESTVSDGREILAEALASFARSLVREYGRHDVSCHVVVDDRLEGSPDGSRCPAAECVLFLASPGASFVAGETIRIGKTASSTFTVKEAR